MLLYKRMLWILGVLGLDLNPPERGQRNTSLRALSGLWLTAGGATLLAQRLAPCLSPFLDATRGSAHDSRAQQVNDAVGGAGAAVTAACHVLGIHTAAALTALTLGLSLLAGRYHAVAARLAAFACCAVLYACTAELGLLEGLNQRAQVATFIAMLVPVGYGMALLQHHLAPPTPPPSTPLSVSPAPSTQLPSGPVASGAGFEGAGSPLAAPS